MSDTGHNLCLVSHISLLSCGCVVRNHQFPQGGTFWFSLIREEMRLPHWMFQPNNYHVEKRVLGGGEETDHQWTHGFLHIHRGAAPLTPSAAPALHTHYHLTRLLSNQHTQPNNLYSSYWIAFQTALQYHYLQTGRHVSRLTSSSKWVGELTTVDWLKL